MCSKVAQGVTERCQRFQCVIVCSGWLKRVSARFCMLYMVTGRTVLLCAELCCNILKYVASNLRYVNIYDNRYLNRNGCVHKDKFIWDTGECMKVEVNHLYDRRKEIQVQWQMEKKETQQ